MRLVVDAEDQPCAFRAAQVCLIGKRREVSPDLVRGEVLVAALELNNLVLPVANQPFQQRRQFMFGHAKTPFVKVYRIMPPSVSRSRPH